MSDQHGKPATTRHSRRRRHPPARMAWLPRSLGAPRANMLVVAVAYGIFAASLGFQPSRWASTPAYHNLLRLLPQPGWASAFAAVASLLAAAAAWHRPWLSYLALTLGIVLTTGWAGAFVVRWLTSGNTTPETWVSWAIFDYLLLRAVALIDDEEARILPRPEDPPHHG